MTATGKIDVERNGHLDALKAKLTGGDYLKLQTMCVEAFGADAGIFCRELLYQMGRSTFDGWAGSAEAGFIYRSQADWRKTTGLKRRGQERARKVLAKKGVLLERRALGKDRRQVLYYALDLPALADRIGIEIGGFELQPSTQAQGCPVLPDTDPAHQWRARTPPGITGQGLCVRSRGEVVG